MHESIPSITFYNPSRALGGSELLFIRLAIYFHNKGVDTHYVDYRDGYARRELADVGVNIIDFDPHRKTIIDYDTCIVTSANYLYRIHSHLTVNTDFKILYWSLHPLNIINTLPYAKFAKYLNRSATKSIINLIYARDVQNLKRLLTFLKDKHSLYFMDHANFEMNQFLFDLDDGFKSYLPIFCNDSTVGQASSSLVNNEEINLAWLGRYSPDKIYSLLYVIDKASQYAESHGCNLVMHLIGYGEKESLLDKIHYSQNIKIRKAGVLTGDQLDRYLVDNVDVLFAMGTSSLEGAKLKIPVVLLDISYKLIRHDYQFRWLHESLEYSLGEVLQHQDHRKGHRFEEIVEAIREKKENHGDLSYKYYKNHHNIHVIANTVLDLIQHKIVPIENPEQMRMFKSSLLYRTMQYLRTMLRKTGKVLFGDNLS